LTRVATQAGALAGRRTPGPIRTIIELSLFANGRPGPELEWMIFEVNEDYVSSVLLPRMVSVYLNPGAEAVYDVSVSWSGSNGLGYFLDAKRSCERDFRG
jgi:hypothetical protein